MTTPAPLPDKSLIAQALSCKCPKCGQGDLYQGKFSLTVAEQCASCGLKLADHDSGDGPAVFLIFILGFLLVPLAFIFENLFSPPLWVHAVLWGAVALAITLGAMRPLKAYVIALQYKHRPGDWQDEEPKSGESS
ncbi:MAG: DUF983 domain-containing protein [Rhodospirillales bacterium]|nr:DUF983 domain-containing protein [Rhodospirillales bacterium]MCB9996183.1 DUF983 domain-containing protein [Rhodospirillales bacterium]